MAYNFNDPNWANEYRKFLEGEYAKYQENERTRDADQSPISFGNRIQNNGPSNSRPVGFDLANGVPNYNFSADPLGLYGVELPGNLVQDDRGFVHKQYDQPIPIYAAGDTWLDKWFPAILMTAATMGVGSALGAGAGAAGAGAGAGAAEGAALGGAAGAGASGGVGSALYGSGSLLGSASAPALGSSLYGAGSVLGTGGGFASGAGLFGAAGAGTLAAGAGGGGSGAAAAAGGTGAAGVGGAAGAGGSAASGLGGFLGKNAGSIIGAASSLLGSGSSGGGGSGGVSGGAGSNVQRREPWEAAAPWLRQNIAEGQALQAGLRANPFNSLQQQAYGNQFANANQMRAIMNSVNAQAAGNRPFDRGNPNARPQRYQFPQATNENMGMGTYYGSTMPQNELNALQSRIQGLMGAR